MSTSTLDGWVPDIGDLVWQQMYSPAHPEWGSSIEERVSSGRFYGGRRLMRLAGVVDDYARGSTRWHLVDPDRPNDDSRMSWVESDWCVLESAAADNGMLF